jgi:hypothetical protein
VEELVLVAQVQLVEALRYNPEGQKIVSVIPQGAIGIFY